MIVNEKFVQFEQSLNQELPSSDLTPLLKSLWYAGKKDWTNSHNIVEQINSLESSWIHAYLHRWEGDEWNANYWYSKAKRNMPTISLDEEWKHIVRFLLDNEPSI